jgi:hypothetical protein
MPALKVLWKKVFISTDEVVALAQGSRLSPSMLYFKRLAKPFSRRARVS